MSEVILKCPSTQSELKNRLLADKELKNFYWIQALEQTLGRGRQGRDWVSPPGNLYLSVLIRGPIDLVTWVPHRVALALCECVFKVGAQKPSIKIPIKIKWPNDLVLLGSDKPEKFAGLICEKVGDHFIVGVGINIKTAPKIDRPISALEQIFSKNIEIDLVRDRFLIELEKEFSDPSDFQSRYVALQYFQPGQKIKWDAGEGEFLKIGEHGQMVVKLPTGDLKDLFSEDVHLLK